MRKTEPIWNNGLQSVMGLIVQNLTITHIPMH